MKYPRDYPADVNPFDGLDYVQYDPATGAIVQWGTMTRIAFDNEIESGLSLLRARASGEDSYVDTATLTIHPKLPGAAVLDGLVLKNLPVPCEVWIDQHCEIVTDGEADFSGWPSGLHAIRVVAPKTLTQAFTLTID